MVSQMRIGCPVTFQLSSEQHNRAAVRNRIVLGYKKHRSGTILQSATAKAEVPTGAKVTAEAEIPTGVKVTAGAAVPTGAKVTAESEILTGAKVTAETAAPTGALTLAAIAPQEWLGGG